MLFKQNLYIYNKTNVIGTKNQWLLRKVTITANFCCFAKSSGIFMCNDYLAFSWVIKRALTPNLFLNNSQTSQTFT